MADIRTWLFRFLVILGAGLMIYSWLLPWWSVEIVALQSGAQIRPWGLEDNLGEVAGFIEGVEMPGWFAVFMWAYLGLSILALVVGAFLKDLHIKLLGKNFNLPQLIIGLVGFSYVVVVVTAVIFAAIRTGDYYGLSLIGTSRVSVGPYASDAHAGLLPGYWMACATGPILILLALFKNNITRKP